LLAEKVKSVKREKRQDQLLVEKTSQFGRRLILEPDYIHHMDNISKQDQPQSKRP
jgi:hypothetical protein